MLDKDAKYNTLAEFFEKTGIKQRKLAEVLDIDETEISRIKTGVRTPSLKLAIRISDLTGVPIRNLYQEEEVAS